MMYPTHLIVETTTRCNLKCFMCPARGLDYSTFGHMDDFLWDRIMEVAPNVQLVTMNGIGESLTHPAFLQRLQQMDRLGIKTGFSTNGTLLKDAAIDVLSTLENIAYINVSLDTPDPEIYNRIRGVNLQETISRLKALLSALRHPEIVFVSAMVMKCSLQSLVEFPELLNRLGIKSLALQKVFYVDNPIAREESNLDQAELSNVLNQIKQKCSEFGIILQGNYFLNVSPSESGQLETTHQESLSKQCLSPWQSPFITKDGKVFTCCSSHPDCFMGDLRRDSFEKIWNGYGFNRFRKRLVDGQDIPGACRECPVAVSGEHPLKGKWRSPTIGIIERFKAISTIEHGKNMPILDYVGCCPICNREVRFMAEQDRYRDHLLCSDCKSLPRHRSFFHVLKMLFPNYRELMIHESMPVDHIAKKMFHDCPGYTSSHCWPDVGNKKVGNSYQDLENLTFPDESFNIFITMDVMDHILDPAKAFQEIARVLKPGGAHIFTVPIHNRDVSIIRANRDGHNIKYLMPPEYHTHNRSLVTREWGKDIIEQIFQVAGLQTAVYSIQNRNMGILGAMTDVLVSYKQSSAKHEAVIYKQYIPEHDMRNLLNSGIRCYKDNGINYTVRHIFKLLKDE